MFHQSKIALLSKHLFWDTDVNNIEIVKNKAFIIHRVLEYGFWNDWCLIVKWYGISEIGSVASGFRSLDAKAFSFISNLSGIPKNQFRCCTSKQLI